jgi:hypothetical protein
MARSAWCVQVALGGPGRTALVVLLLTGLVADASAQVPPPSAAGLPPERVVRVQVPPPQPAPRPFLMGFEFLTVLEEDGDLAHPGQSAQSVGLRFVFREGRALRQHLAFAHHWEEQGNVTRRGFRLDLISIGFPIPVFAPEPPSTIHLAVEPILRVLRGEVLFESIDNGPTRSQLRVESGFALALSASYRKWFLVLEPLSIDFRYLLMTRVDSRSGFSRIWSLAGTVGREF